MAAQQYHFVLLHGGGYGSWAWYRVEARLQKAGHKVSAMDMVGAGIHPADPDAITTFDEYHKPALDFFEALEAHSESAHVKVLNSFSPLFKYVIY